MLNFFRDFPAQLLTSDWVLMEVADALTGDKHFKQAGFTAWLK